MIKMKEPEKDKRVLVFVEDGFPFVGYWNGEEWLMETEILNCDTHRNDVFAIVSSWIELPTTGF